MALKSKHWTENSTKDFIYRIASDFIEQINAKLDEAEGNREELAKALGVSKGRVSQILNNPGNFTLKMIVKCARVLGLKVSIVAYEDKEDAGNRLGPIDSEIFRTCWNRMGAPRDYWTLDAQPTGFMRLNTQTAVGFIASDSELWANSAWSCVYHFKPKYEDEEQPLEEGDFQNLFMTSSKKDEFRMIQA